MSVQEKKPQSGVGRPRRVVLGGGEAGNLTIRLEELKAPFAARAAEICGNASALVQAFCKVALQRPKEQVWAFCFNYDAAATAAGRQVLADVVKELERRSEDLETSGDISAAREVAALIGKVKQLEVL